MIKVPIELDTLDGKVQAIVRVPPNPLYVDLVRFQEQIALLVEYTDNNKDINEAKVYGYKVKALEVLGVDFGDIPTDLLSTDFLIDSIIDVATSLIENIEPEKINTKKVFKFGFAKFYLTEKRSLQKLGLITTSARRAIETKHIASLYNVKEDDKPTMKVAKGYKAAMGTVAHLLCKRNENLPLDNEQLDDFINKRVELLQNKIRVKDVKSIAFFLSNILGKLSQKRSTNSYTRNLVCLAFLSLTRRQLTTRQLEKKR